MNETLSRQSSGAPIFAGRSAVHRDDPGDDAAAVTAVYAQPDTRFRYRVVNDGAAGRNLHHGAAGLLAFSGGAAGRPRRVAHRDKVIEN